jgi:hypothetical protein
MSPVIETSVVGRAVGACNRADGHGRFPSRVLGLRASDQNMVEMNAGGRVKGLAARSLRSGCGRWTTVVFRQHSGRGPATIGCPDPSARCERTKEGRPEPRRRDVGACTRRFALDAPRSDSRVARVGPTTPKQFDERGCQIHWPIPLTADREKLWPASPEVKRRSKPIRSGSRRRKGRSREF